MHCRFGPGRRAGLDLAFAQGVDAHHDQGDDKEYAPSRERGVDRAIGPERSDKTRGAEKRDRDEQGEGRYCRERRQPQGGAGPVLDIIDQARKHRRLVSKIMPNKSGGGASAPLLKSSYCFGRGYRRHVTPIRKPRPTARPTVASGRSVMTSSRVSSIETAAALASSTSALPHSDMSSTAASTVARASL